MGLARQRLLGAFLAYLCYGSVQASGEETIELFNRFSPNTNSRVHVGHSYQNGVLHIESGYLHQTVTGHYDLVLLVNVENRAYHKNFVLHVGGKTIEAEWRMPTESETSGAFVRFISHNVERNRDHVVIVARDLPIDVKEGTSSLGLWIHCRMDTVDYLVVDSAVILEPEFCAEKLRQLARD